MIIQGIIQNFLTERGAFGQLYPELPFTINTCAGTISIPDNRLPLEQRKSYLRRANLSSKPVLTIEENTITVRTDKLEISLTRDSDISWTGTMTAIDARIESDGVVATETG